MSHILCSGSEAERRGGSAVSPQQDRARLRLTPARRAAAAEQEDGAHAAAELRVCPIAAGRHVLHQGTGEEHALCLYLCLYLQPTHPAKRALPVHMHMHERTSFPYELLERALARGTDLRLISSPDFFPLCSLSPLRRAVTHPCRLTAAVVPRLVCVALDRRSRGRRMCALHPAA